MFLPTFGVTVLPPSMSEWTVNFRRRRQKKPVNIRHALHSATPPQLDPSTELEIEPNTPFFSNRPSVTAVPCQKVVFK
jgi:hypothetical protein